MLLEEEARKREEGIQHAREIEDVSTLKRVLHESLTAFENMLNTLPPSDRQEAFSAYLNKIRKVTFGFHLAVLRQTARREFGKNPTRDVMQSILARSAEKMQDIAHIYRFL